MLTALIIDDEEKGRLVLRQKLADHCPDVVVIGEADGGENGKSMIESLRPDVVFLDIEMPGINGFEMLNKLNEKNFHLIFTTAYNQYAIKAIKFAAFDYLLKPIDIEELKAAISRIRNLKTADVSGQLEVLTLNSQKSIKNFNKIAIPTLDGFSFFDLNELIHLDADSNYTLLHFTENRKILASRTLKEFEDQLEEERFIRLHNSHLVNVSFITRYIKGEGGQVVLANGKIIDVSRRKKADLMKMLLQ
ncbi:MAG: response regulator [Saprospiraceae bacterium]|nr:response regulator [Saprospiraceae bacterium]MBK7790914.1 response regulator [Saprospiraceae bacterium]MBK9687474.1 response regulator [Saprospiraceae bacterium]MBL0084114.1 response regulator [Saprospiraceae bacterium]